MSKFLSLLGFDPTKHHVRTEMVAGLTTFLTMSYIMAVNPIILSATGMDKGAVFSATVVAAVIATLTMAFYAKLPYALASGMGLNAFFAYTLVITMGYTWQQALAVVLFEGVIFILLTLFKVREIIADSIPADIRYAISVGIGLFIAYLGLKNGGIIVSDENNLTTLGPWDNASLIAIGGILLGAILLATKVRGALFYVILLMTLIGIPLGVTKIPEHFTLISWPVSMEPVAFHVDFSLFLNLEFDFIIIVITLLIMDMFDTIGTLIGASMGAKMVDSKGRVPNMNKALMADAVGTTVGALCGTSTVTTFVESTTGIMEGGRTGLTSFTVAMLFLVALFFSPLFLIIPAAATTSALFLVGLMMTAPLKDINFKDISTGFPCFLTIIIMPLAGSISEGIVMGMLAYIVMKIFTGQARQLPVTMYILGIIFILKYLTPLF